MKMIFSPSVAFQLMKHFKSNVESLKIFNNQKVKFKNSKFPEASKN
jgi:hypothetical protein